MTQAPSSGDKYFDLWTLLYFAYRAIHRARRRELAHYGISREQAAVLHLVADLKDKATPSEVARQNVTDPQAASNLITRMEKVGLVKRVRDRGRKNLVRIAMTKEGKRKYAFACRRESIHEVLSVLSDKKIKQMVSILQILLDKLMFECGTTYKRPFSVGKTKPRM